MEEHEKNTSTAGSTIEKATKDQGVLNGLERLNSSTAHKDPERGESQTEPSKLDVVGWDGPRDPNNPQNWSEFKRVGHVVIISVNTLVVNLAATMFAPGASSLMESFSVTSSTVGTLTVSIYMLGFAFGPLFLAPISELNGRLKLFHVCNIVYFAFTLGCAKSTNIGMFLAFRFIAGCAGSAPITVGGGTIADVMPQEQRGKAMGIFALGPLVGPIVGPIAGGFVAETIGWRWTFWIISICSGVMTTVTIVFMRETFAKVLLERKAARIAKEGGKEVDIPSGYKKPSIREVFARALIRPVKMLIYSPIIDLLSIYVAFVFGLIFLLFTTFPSVFEETYGFTVGTSGLAYLGLGIGMMTGLVIFARFSDKILHKRAANGHLKAEDRLPLMVAFAPVIPIGFFWYGWSAHAHTHWIVPIIGTSFIGFGALFVLMPAQLYLVDAFGPQAAASALAVLTLLRCIAAAFLPLAGPPMYENLGLGWGNSLLGFIGLGFTPVPLFFFRYGEYLRERFPPRL